MSISGGAENQKDSFSCQDNSPDFYFWNAEILVEIPYCTYF